MSEVKQVLCSQENGLVVLQIGDTCPECGENHELYVEPDTGDGYDTSGQTWTRAEGATPEPLGDTYRFEMLVRPDVRYADKEHLMRWLNAKHPEQDAIEKRAFWRIADGEEPYDSEEEAKASQNSDLVRAHYALHSNTRYYVTAELKPDGSIRLILPEK